MPCGGGGGTANSQLDYTLRIITMYLEPTNVFSFYIRSCFVELAIFDEEKEQDFDDFYDNEDDDKNDETEALMWSNDTSSPYFGNSSSTCSQVGKKSRASTYGRRTYKRKFRRRKKATPKYVYWYYLFLLNVQQISQSVCLYVFRKRSSKSAAKTKKSPAKALAQNRALTARQLKFLSVPKQYAHCASASSSKK